mmetsp:Transcript_30388/g.87059  ORF Transcript_30388/g.87059 Transcript_30388/m.87059 type:complete len:211 (+) Transcript_30388:1612-2244(+)
MLPANPTWRTTSRTASCASSWSHSDSARRAMRASNRRTSAARRIGTPGPRSWPSFAAPDVAQSPSLTSFWPPFCDASAASRGQATSYSAALRAGRHPRPAQKKASLHDLRSNRARRGPCGTARRRAHRLLRQQPCAPCLQFHRRRPRTTCRNAPTRQPGQRQSHSSPARQSDLGPIQQTRLPRRQCSLELQAHNKTRASSSSYHCPCRSA